MNPKPLTVLAEIPIVDADGVAILVGSVLERVDGTDRGVVTQIVLPGALIRCVLIPVIGDLEIETSPSCRRITNQWAKWRHIPKERQTYRERFRSWQLTPYEHDDNNGKRSSDEGLAIDGILALLPPDAVDWDYGPWPDSIEEALGFLETHLTQLADCGS